MFFLIVFGFYHVFLAGRTAATTTYSFNRTGRKFSVILVISHLVIFDFTLCIFAHYNNKKYFFIIIVADLGCPKMILTK